VVDEVRVLRLLRAVSDDLAFLRAEATAEAARRADPMWLRGVKYSFVTAIEACVDTAQHLCSSQGWGPPADNGDTMRLLGQHGVLHVEHAEHMRQAVGFRNVLVHEYVRLDDAIVLSRLADLSDLERFVSSVVAYVKPQ
jgi:uncharacterized protein YutE (UPF0331/DUF86 family)